MTNTERPGGDTIDIDDVFQPAPEGAPEPAITEAEPGGDNDDVNAPSEAEREAGVAQLAGEDEADKERAAWEAELARQKAETEARGDDGKRGGSWKDTAKAVGGYSVVGAYAGYKTGQYGWRATKWVGRKFLNTWDGIAGFWKGSFIYKGLKKLVDPDNISGSLTDKDHAENIKKRNEDAKNEAKARDDAQKEYNTKVKALYKK